MGALRIEYFHFTQDVSCKIHMSHPPDKYYRSCRTWTLWWVRSSRRFAPPETPVWTSSEDCRNLRMPTWLLLTVKAAHSWDKLGHKIWKQSQSESAHPGPPGLARRRYSPGLLCTEPLYCGTKSEGVSSSSSRPGGGRHPAVCSCVPGGPLAQPRHVEMLESLQQTGETSSVPASNY